MSSSIDSCDISGEVDQNCALGAPIPGSIWNGPLAEGAIGKSKIAVGMYTVAQEFGMSTTPDRRPSIGADPSSRYACSGLYPNLVR